MTLIARACRVALVMLAAVIVLQTGGALSASELEPTNVRVTPGDGILGVTWEPPAEQDVTVVKYVVNYTIPRLYGYNQGLKFCGWNYAGATWTDVASTQTSYTITGLQNGQEYCVRVGARFARTSGYSSEILATPSSGEQPLLVSANAVGATLRLTFDELLDANSVPPTSVFTVVAGGSTVAVSGVNIQGTQVTLTLSSATSASDAVTLSYAVPTGATAQPLQDWLGNQAPALSNQVVVNTGTASSDATLSALTVTGATLTPAFSSATEQYRAVVPYSVTAATVTPTPSDSGATVAFSPSVDADTNASGHQVPLGAGQNTLDIVVTAENTIDRKTYTLSLTRSLAPPEAPASNYLSSRNDGELSIRWWPPARDGGSPVVGYKVQWTSDPNSWESSDQAIVTEMVLIGITSRWAYKITGLQNGTEYRMRVIAYNLLGDSEPTNEITGTPISLDSYLLSFIEDQVVAVYGNSSPWLRTSWEHMKRNGKVFNIVESSPGSAAVQSSCSTRADGLRTCRVTGTVIQESIVDLGAAQLSKILIHEMAHYYDKNSDLSGDIAALSAFRLYLESLPVNAGNNCRISELYADVFLLSVLPDAVAGYWDACTGWNSTTTAEAVAVMRSAVSGTMPAWFSTTYGAIADGPDLEKLWADVKSMEGISDRSIVVYQLRNSFGGYCNNSKAAESAFEDGVARNPWRDGGCVPDAPGSVAANAAGSGKLAVSWSAPASDGGSPIEGYRIQWKSGSQQYDTSRQAVVVDVAERNAHTIAGLTNGTEHSVRIVSYNQNGDGASTEVTATPSATDTAAPELLRATVDSAALVLTWNEALDTASVPAAETFSVTVASNDRAVDDVVITGSAVELTLASPVVAGEVVSVSYAVPMAPGAAPIRDSSRNAAASFTDTSVRNSTAPVSSDTSIKRVMFGRSPNSGVTGTRMLSSGNYEATSSVSWATSLVHLAVEPSNSDATVTISPSMPAVGADNLLGSYCGQPGHDCRIYEFEPSVGENVITVSVTAEDGITQDSFTATLVRQPRPVTIEFAKAVYAVTEGGTASVTVRLNHDPERTVTIPIIVTPLGGASPLEYTSSSSVTFTSGGPLSQTVTVTASADSEAEQGEHIVLGLGRLPDGVESGTVTTASVTLQDEDSTPPELESVSVSGSALTLLYDEALDTGSIPPTSAYAVRVAGATRSVTAVSLSGATVELQLSAAVAASEPVYVSYTVPTTSGESRIRDTANNDAAGFTNRSVPNHAIGAVCDRTREVRDAIAERFMKDCSEITVGELAMIQRLEIVRGVSALRTDDLSGLTGLRTLGMSWHRNLTTIPRNVFYGLSKLETLLLSSNKLTVLEAGAFSGPNSLRNLNLSDNRLSSLPDGIFSGLSSLEYLNLSGNNIDPLPVDIGLEAAGNGAFKTTAHSGAPFRIELPIVVTNGQLSDGSSTVVIPAGSTESAPVAVARLAYETGAVTVDIGTLPSLPSSSHSGYSLVKFGSLPLEIATDAVIGTSEISIASASSPVTEGTAAAFTLTRTGDTAAALTVDVSVSETGATVAGSAPATATFAAGSGTTELSVATEDDTVVEAASTITATVAAGTGYDVDASASFAEVAVNDNDAATFTVSASPAQIEEGEASTLTVAIANGVTFAADQTIALDFAASTAVAADYAVADGGGQALASPYALTLAAGASTVTATVTATDDAEQEPAETIEAAASHEGSAIGSASIEVAASDGLTARFENLPESHDGSAAFQFELHFSEEFRIGYRKLRDRAFEVSGGTVTRARRLKKGSNIGWQVTIEPDTDGDIAVTLPARACGERGAVCTTDGQMLSEAVSVTVPGPASGLPTISIASGSSPVTEGTAAAFTLTRTGDVAAELTVEVSVSETGAMVSGTAPETATFAAGSATAELSVATKDDEVVEDASTITAAVAAGTGYSLDANATSAEVEVQDDDAPPVITTVSPVVVAENESVVTTLTATDEDTAEASFVWAIPLGSMGGTDAASFTLTTAGVLSFTAARDYEAPDDADQDGDYEVTVRVVDGYNWTDKALIVRLTDVDEIAPELSSASADGDLLTLSFSEALDESAPPALSAFSATVDGAGRRVSNVAMSGSAVTLTLASAVVAVETVTVGYAAPTGANASPLRDLAGNPAADFSDQAVTNDTPANTAPEGLPTISGVAQEGETLTASASEVSDADGITNAVFAWQWLANDGTVDADIADATGATYTLTSADAGKAVKVRLTYTDDRGTEESLVSAATAAVAAAPPEVSIAAATSTVTEGTSASFTLSRTGDTADALTVAVSVSEAGDVLSGTPASTVTFVAGSGTATLGVATEDDGVAEADGRVTASLVAGSGYIVDNDAASASIAVFDNDQAAATAAVETLWTSTLTVLNFRGIIIGRHDGLGGSLSPDGWTEDGVRYSAGDLYFYPGSSELAFATASAPPEPGQLTLHLDDLQLRLDDVEGLNFFVWAVEDPGWQDGQEVAVKLTREDPDSAAATPPGIAVADAQVQEAEGAALSFRVTLDSAQSGAVSVRYATSNGTAVAGADYEAVSGALHFEAGQTRKTVRVPVLNDSHDEGSETLTLTLSRPFGAQLTDARATGTIVNTGPIPQAWLARFGRTAAEHVLGGVEERLTAAREAGTRIAIAGQMIGSEASPGIDGADPTTGGTEMGEALGVLLEGMASGSGDNTTSGSLDEAYPWNDASSGGDDTLSRGMTSREVLAGTSLQFGSETSGGGLASLWGRGAYTSFSGQEGGMAIEGDVSTATLGADYASGGWIAGLALSQSRGEGSWRDGDAGGAIESDVTGLYPYAAYGIGERFSLWGTVGYGSGTLTVSPEGHEPLEAVLALRMAAAGARGALLSSEQGDGFDLAVKTDVLGVQTSSEAVEGSGGRLEATTADVTRLRLALEGSWEASLGTDSSLRPTFEVGLRHDGGDAETGFGLEFGGGLALTDPVLGLSAEIRGHGLLTHEESTFRDHGVSGSLRYDPQPYSDLGLSLIVSPSWGAGQRGVESMWETAPGVGAALGSFDNFGGADSPDGRLDAEIGYGLPALSGRATGMPWARVGLAEGAGDYRLGYRLNISGTELGIEYGQSEYDRDYRLGYGFGFVEGGRLAFHLGAELTRRVSANDNDADDQAAIRATLRW